ncbi:MAG: MATE family efflux transporter [Arenibacterium sp.]
MRSVMTYPGHVRAILVLGLPLVGGHLAQFAIGMTDTIMVGWYGVAELAAATLAQSYFFVFFMFGTGFAMAVMPMVAAAVASDDETGIRRSTRMGMWLSLLFAVLVIPAMWWSEPLLILLGQKPSVAADAQTYLRIAGWGIIPALLVMVIKSYLAALERTQIVFWITILAAVTNAIINYALIFGNWGAPELGLIGAAIASVVTQLVSLAAIVLYAAKVLPEHTLFRRLWRPDWEMFARVFRLGVPIGMTLLSEVSMFAASALMMGWIGTVALAAHGIVVSIAGATFMFHLGLSNAATIRAGNAFGRKDRDHMARGALAVTILSLVFALITIVAFLTIPAPIIGLFLDSNDPVRPQIIEAGIVLLAVAALFQLVDGAQVIALGLLSGVPDTTLPMILAGLASWVVGITSSYVLGFVFGMGGPGIWLGLVLGLSCAGIFLMTRFWTRTLPSVATA